MWSLWDKNVHIHFECQWYGASVADTLRILLGMVESVCQRWLSVNIQLTYGFSREENKH